MNFRDGFMLDLFTARYVEVRAWYEKKIATGEVYPCLFVVYPESPNAQKYNFKVIMLKYMKAE